MDVAAELAAAALLDTCDLRRHGRRGRCRLALEGDLATARVRRPAGRRARQAGPSSATRRRAGRAAGALAPRPGRERPGPVVQICMDTRRSPRPTDRGHRRARRPRRRAGRRRGRRLVALALADPRRGEHLVRGPDVNADHGSRDRAAFEVAGLTVGRGRCCADVDVATTPRPSLPCVRRADSPSPRSEAGPCLTWRPRSRRCSPTSSVAPVRDRGPGRHPLDVPGPRVTGHSTAMRGARPLCRARRWTSAAARAG
jgi:hypothetical protein